MDDLSGVVERLRAVRVAERKFFQLWAVEQAVIVPGLDRVAADIESAVLGSGCWDSSGIKWNDSGMGLGE